MAGWAAVGLGVLSISGGIKQKKSSKKASNQQREIGRLNERNILAQGVEEHRRSSKDFDKIMGKTEAIIQGSGVRGLSRKMYMEGLQNEMDKQLDWITSSASSRGEAARAGANVVADQTRSSGDAALLNSIISAGSMVLPTLGTGATPIPKSTL